MEANSCSCFIGSQWTGLEESKYYKSVLKIKDALKKITHRVANHWMCCDSCAELYNLSRQR